MSIDTINIKMKDGSLMPIRKVYADVVQIKSIDESDKATAVRGDNSRIEVQLAAGQSWIAGSEMKNRPEIG